MTASVTGAGSPSFAKLAMAAERSTASDRPSCRKIRDSSSLPRRRTRSAGCSRPAKMSIIASFGAERAPSSSAPSHLLFSVGCLGGDRLLQILQFLAAGRAKLLQRCHLFLGLGHV